MQAAYCFIDLVGSRTNFTDQTQILTLLQHLQKKLNDRFPDLLTPFMVKDGDGLLGGFQAADQSQLADLFVFCNAYLRSVAFRQFWQPLFGSTDLPEFYFGVGLGNLVTVEKTDYQDVNRINGSAIVNALTAVDQAKRLMQGATLPLGYPFSTSLFKWQLVTDQAAETANGVSALLYLIYERLLNTKLRKEAFALLYAQPNLKRYQLAQILWEAYGNLTYQVDYTQQKERAVASSKISRLLNQMDYPLIEQTLTTVRAQLMSLAEVNL